MKSRKNTSNLLKREFGLKIEHIMRFKDKTEDEILRNSVETLRIYAKQLLISFGAWLERNNQIISFNHKRLNDFLNEKGD